MGVTPDKGFKMNIAPYNKLPVIIDGPGVYITRSGRRVLIHAVEFYSGEYDRLEVTAFEAKGAVERMFRGKPRFRGLESWHVSGRNKACNELSPLDIVTKDKISG